MFTHIQLNILNVFLFREDLFIMIVRKLCFSTIAASALIASANASLDRGTFNFGVVGTLDVISKKTNSATAMPYSNLGDLIAQKTSTTTDLYAAGDTNNTTPYSTLTAAAVSDKAVGFSGVGDIWLANFVDARGADGETLERPLMGIGVCGGFAYPLNKSVYFGVDAGILFNPTESNNTRTLYTGEKITVAAESDAKTGVIALDATGDEANYKRVAGDFITLKNRFSAYADLVLGMRNGAFVFVGGNFAGVQTKDFRDVTANKKLFGFELGFGLKTMLAKNLCVTVAVGYSKQFTELSHSFSNTFTEAGLVDLSKGAVALGATPVSPYSTSTEVTPDITPDGIARAANPAHFTAVGADGTLATAADADDAATIVGAEDAGTAGQIIGVATPARGTRVDSTATTLTALPAAGAAGQFYLRSGAADVDGEAMSFDPGMRVFAADSDLGSTGNDSTTVANARRAAVAMVAKDKTISANTKLNSFFARVSVSINL